MRSCSGPIALDRRDRALQHVVATAELAGALDRDDVARLLDHAEQRGVAPIVAAERAQLALGDVEAAPAPRDAVLRVDDRARRAGWRRRARPAGGRTRCAAPTSARCPAADRARRSAPGPVLRRALTGWPASAERGRRGRAPRSSPPVTRAELLAAAPSPGAGRRRPRRRTRSSSVSTSSGSTTLGSIVIAARRPSR